MEAQECLATYVFSRSELLRLATYRAAVRAGFYNDGIRRPRRRLTRAAAKDEALLESFTVQERARLVVLREARERGLFDEQAA